MRIWLAIRTFFQVLFNAEFASAVQRCAASQTPTPGPAVTDVDRKTEKKAEKKVEKAAAPRSDAVTLLAVLQREARFVDMVQEPLDGYSDAQVGAAARDVLRDCGAVLQRLFQLQPLADQPEGESLEIPAGYDPGRYRLTGNVDGEPPFTGHLVHHGWRATQCQLPTWSGSPESRLVVAPVEVEMR